MSDLIVLPEIPLWSGILLGLLLFIGTLILVPWIVIRIPADYFVGAHRPVSVTASLHPVLRIIMLLLKNILGLAVVLMGIAMLVLPGQGLLTILIGFMLLDFPGKFACERWLVSRQLVLRSVNWLRHRSHKAPLEVPGPGRKQQGK